MKKIQYSKRIDRQIRNAIDVFQLDLTDLTVMTEAASGAFVTTSIIAAMAGARVLAFTRDSLYGQAVEICDYVNSWASQLGLLKKIHVLVQPPAGFASEVDIVTNLGFVRPISSELIYALPPHAVISLMWEPWEFRPGDIDLYACKNAQIPVIGTRETDSRLNTFRHVGTLALKLLLERNIEIFGSKIVLIGSNPFESAVYKALTSLGASVTRIKNVGKIDDLDLIYGRAVDRADALVLVEHRIDRELIGFRGGIHPARIKGNNVELIHICGQINNKALIDYDIFKWPIKEAPFGYMTVTTDYIGPLPVIDLHCAGLRVGGVASRVRKAGGSLGEAVEAAEATGLGVRLDL